MTVIRREAFSLCGRGLTGAPVAALSAREFLLPDSLGRWLRASTYMGLFRLRVGYAALRATAQAKAHSSRATATTASWEGLPRDVSRK